MSAATLFAAPFVTITDDDGNPVPGALISVYEAGSTTPVDVFHDSDLMSVWTQPIQCDGNGKTSGPVFVSQTPSLKIVVTDANLVPVPPFPVDDITPYVLAS
jgi:hypothetical protein